MSWMDSWSRPGKSQPVPAPYYLLPNGGGETPYCRSCGRVISSRRTTAAAAGAGTGTNDSTASGGGGGSVVKYCSARCRHSKPGKLDREIEDVFVQLLQGQSHEEVVAAVALARETAGESGVRGQGEAQNGGADGRELAHIAETPVKDEAKTRSHQYHKRHKSKSTKGDNRILVLCDEVEEIVFGPKTDPAKIYGRKKNRASRVIHAHEGDDSGGRGPGTVERGPSYGTTKYQTDSGDSAIELDDDDDDGDFDDGEHSDEHEGHLHPRLHRKSVSNNNKLHQGTGLDGHTAAALSVRSGTRVRPAQVVSEVNGSVGGEKGWAERTEESEEMTQRRIEGQQRAQRKEMVRCAARRLVVFGSKIDPEQFGSTDGGGGGSDNEGKLKAIKKKKKTGKGSSKSIVRDDTETAVGGSSCPLRKCEAVMQGNVVEPSYAKGNWGVRWRED